MSSNATVPVDLGPIAGPVLLGSLLNWGLFGVLSLQVYLYHGAFPSDSTSRKVLVYALFLLDAAQTFIVTGDVFDIYARHYGELDQLTKMHNEWLAVPVFSSIVSAIVQIYYGIRIRYLSGSRCLMGLVISLALMQSIAGIVTGVQAEIIGNFQGLEQKAHSNTIVWLAGSAACDVLIAVMMSYLLLRKVESAQADTRAMVTRIVQLIIETGTLTAFAAILVLVLYVALPQRAYYSCIGAILAKLYANSLLVMFNSRMQISERRMRGRSRAISHESLEVKVGVPGVDGIHVQEQVFVHTDEMEMSEQVSLGAKKSCNGGVW